MSTHSRDHTQQAHNIDFKQVFSVTKEPGSQVKIVGEIPYSELLLERQAAIKALGANVELDGFRKGHVPESMLVKHIGEMAILGEMAERTIANLYPHILQEHNIDAIGRPQVDVTKLAPENPLGLSITVAVLPVITLPDYKKIVGQINTDKPSKEVTEEEVTKQINEILRQKLAYDRLQAKAAKKATPEASAVADTVDPTLETTEDFSKLPLPELTDELTKTLGQPGQFADVADFKAKVTEHLSIQKAQDIESNHRIKITDSIIAESSLELPQILIDSELGQMFAQMEEDLGRSNLKIEDYLAHIKKTPDDLRKDWAPSAEKRAKLQLILNEIAKVEKITPDQVRVAEQVKTLLDQYKDADPYRVGTYVATVLTNEAVMKMLTEVK